MKLTLLFALPALLLSGSVSAHPPVYHKFCIATFHGANDSGGAAPGQRYIDRTYWDLAITGGGKAYEENLQVTRAPGQMVVDVDASRYGGANRIEAGAVWNFLGNKWYSCGILQNGQRYAGKVERSHIKVFFDTATTTDYCKVTFPC